MLLKNLMATPIFFVFRCPVKGSMLPKEAQKACLRISRHKKKFWSARKAAAIFGLDPASLGRYKERRENAPVNTPVDSITMGYNSAKKVFTAAQEKEIVEYAIKSADIYFGITTKYLRKLAYNLTVRYNIKRPASWDKNETAGVEWFRGFIDRHPELSVRCAQATSLARATSYFNIPIVPC